MGDDPAGTGSISAHSLGAPWGLSIIPCCARGPGRGSRGAPVERCPSEPSPGSADGDRGRRRRCGDSCQGRAVLGRPRHLPVHTERHRPERDGQRRSRGVERLAILANQQTLLRSPRAGAVPGGALGPLPPLSSAFPSPGTAFLLDLALPDVVQDRGALQVPPLCGLRFCSQLRVIVRVIPDVAPAAGDAAGREDGLSTLVLLTGRCDLMATTADSSRT